ncbi:MAG: sugar ABC transporter permease [Bifidobacteriaceae bacterium]|jgi:multiple sugar transport system permease protein|nr:sugar ABC transporter permease [Bifidobacteriaceae bacterium]
MTTSTHTAAHDLDAHPPRARGIAKWWRGGGPGKIVFLLPTLFVFGVFSWWPILRGVVLCFQQTNMVTTRWVGFGNFVRVVSDPLTHTAALNTLYFTVLAALFGFAVPVVFATLIAEMRRARRIASVLVFLPIVMPPVVSVLLWKLFYNPGKTGLFNTVLAALGLEPSGWLQDTLIAMPAIMVQVTWASFGSATVIYLAALTSVPADQYDAAEIDGAGILKRFWHVTLPQLRGLLLLMLLLQVIGTFQIFTEPYLMTGGGPNNATLTILLHIFRYAFVGGDFGGATALSVLLAIFLGVLSAVYRRATRAWSMS